MVKVQVNSQGKAFIVNSNKALIAKELGSKSITSNGTYSASSDNLDGYSSVTVNVSGGGGTTVTANNIKGSSVSLGDKVWLNYGSVENFTIHGSVSIDSNHIASGFGTANYITGDSFNTYQNFEIVTKFKQTSTRNTYCQIIGTGNHGLYIGIDNSNHFHLNVGNGGSGWSGGGMTSVNVAANTDYWLKCTRNSNNVVLYYSTNGTSWTQLASINTSYSNTSTFGIGAVSSSADYFTNGYVYLDETYIKVNDVIIWRPYNESDQWSIIDFNYANTNSQTGYALENIANGSSGNVTYLQAPNRGE